MIDISIIIVSWNAKAFLEECLDSLSAPLAQDNVEIFVVDNASSDGSPEMVEAKFPRVKLIQAGGNLGFSKANNLGIRASTGRYVCLINSDVKVLGDCLWAMVKFMDENPTVGIGGPRMLNRDGTMQVSCRKLPSLWNNFCASSGLAAAFPHTAFFTSEQMFYFPHDRVARVEVIAGCYWIVRRSAMDQFGLLDEAFFIYGEDVDWCRRCWTSGWEIVFAPVGEAIHYQGGSSSNDPVRFSVAQQQAVIQYWRKHHSAVAVFFERWILGLGIVLRMVRESIACVVSKTHRARHEKRLKGLRNCLKSLASA